MAAITLYCSWDDVTARISAAAADLRIDDDPSAQQDVLEAAAIEVNGYLQRNYDISSLAQSDWVRFKTRDIALFFLCGRRNHPVPESVAERYEKAIKDLERMESGAIQLPDIAQAKANIPVLSNQRVTMWPFPRVQTVRGKSTGTPENYEKFDDQQDNFNYEI